MEKEIFNVDADLSYKKFDSLTTSQVVKNIGVYIYGKPGVGKTQFFKKYMKNVNIFNKNLKINYIEKFGRIYEILDKPIDIRFCNSQELISDFMVNWYSEVKKPNPINNFVKSDVLLIDDLGAEKLDINTYQYLYELFNKRFDYKSQNTNKKVITIISSNLSIEALEKKWRKNIDNISVDRLISRIKGLANYEIKFEGKDKRFDFEVEHQDQEIEMN